MYNSPKKLQQQQCNATNVIDEIRLILSHVDDYFIKLQVYFVYNTDIENAVKRICIHLFVGFAYTQQTLYYYICCTCFVRSQSRATIKSGWDWWGRKKWVGSECKRTYKKNLLLLSSTAIEYIVRFCCSSFSHSLYILPQTEIASKCETEQISLDGQCIGHINTVMSAVWLLNENW